MEKEFWEKRRVEIIGTFQHGKGRRSFQRIFDEIIIQEQAMLIKEQQTMKELLKAYKELLIEAESLYVHYPNNFRATVEEYFKSDR